MTDAGEDLWQSAPKFPARYLVTLVGAEAVTLARSRPPERAIDVAAPLPVAEDGRVEFLEGRTLAASIADIERVDELTFQAFVQGGGEAAEGEDGDVAHYTDDELRATVTALHDCTTRTFEQNMELARLSGVLAARIRAKGATA